MNQPTRTSIFISAFLILLGAVFRINGLARDSRFHGDEALFASYARQMVLHDWNLNEIPTDKPPTTFLLVGLSLVIWGETEFAARLPNLFASLIGLAAFYAFAQQTTHRRPVANFSLLLWAVSPLEIAYAPTVFQDPPMLTCILLSAWFVARQGWGKAGTTFGLSIIMKPTALWLLPLMLGIGLVSQKNVAGPRSQIKNLIRFTGFILLPIILIVLWDQTRIAQSFIELGRHNNNPGRWIRSDEVWPRAKAWTSLLALMAGHDVLAVAFFCISISWLIVAARRQEGTLSWLIMLYLVWYIGLYWLVAFNPWDRYVLLIAPFAIFLVAQGVAELGRRNIVIGFIIVLSWNNAADAVNRTNPTDNWGIDELGTVLNRDFAGATVYDNWLGWYFLWYLGDEPSVKVIYFPTPEELALYLQDKHEVGYLAAPSAKIAEPWLFWLNNYGIRSEIAYKVGALELYRLYPPQTESVSSSE